MIFASPLMLLGLLAVSIPIAVHLFSFRRYRKVYFSNVERLTRLQQETRRRSKVRELLILASRIGAVAMLVLAFAQPLLPLHEGQKPVTGVQRVSIYLDNSFSMGASSSEGPLLEEGRQKVREIAAAYGPSDQFQLLTNECSGRQFRWLSKNELLAALDETDLSPASPLMSAMVARQQDFAKRGLRGTAHLYVVSDMQASTADLASLAPDSACRLTFVPLQGQETGNLYIDTLEADAPCYHPGSTAVLTAVVRNDGPEPIENAPVSLYVNGRQRALASVTVPAKGSTKTQMSFVADQSGVLSGYVETSDYPVTFDDRLYFSINVTAKNSVLLVNGESENGHLVRLFQGDSSVTCASESVKDLDYSRLDQYDMVVLNEVQTLTSGLGQQLLRLLEAGSTVLVIPSEQADRSSYNTFLAQAGAPVLGDWDPSQTRAARLSTEHPLYQNVFRGEPSQLEMPSVKGRFRLESASGTLQEPLITLTDGRPLLTLSRGESGTLCLFATPLRQPFTDFGHQAMFVPTFYNLLLFSHPAGALFHTLGSQEPITLQQSFGRSGSVSRMTSIQSGTEFFPSLIQRGGRTMMYAGEGIREACNCLLREEGCEEGVSFNYPRAESRMEFLSRSEVAKLLRQNGLDQTQVVENGSKDLERLIREQNEGRPLWRLCLVLSLLFLLCEIVLVVTRPMGPASKK